MYRASLRYTGSTQLARAALAVRSAVDMTMNRCKVIWTGFPGAPGLGTHYFGSTTTDMTALRTFYAAAAALVPSLAQIQISNSGDQIDETTGNLTGSWSGAAQAAIGGGGGAGAYSAASGGMVKWNSSLIVNSRRVSGKTFFVPTVTSAFDATGTLLNSLVTTIQAAVTAVIAAYAGEMKIWHRPNALGVGAAAQIISGTLQDKQFVLRSRRD